MFFLLCFFGEKKKEKKTSKIQKVERNKIDSRKVAGQRNCF